MIIDQWNRLTSLPMGKSVFSTLLGYMVPYTGSIRPQILELRPGYAKIRIRDRRAIRNHLESIHAAALMNIAEAASGLAFVASLPDEARAILVKFTIEYLKKGRGDLYAECECSPPKTFEKQQFVIDAFVKNEAGEVVAKAQATWLVSPKNK